jgi:hypothetical protein
VLFDVNRTIKFGTLLRPSADTALAQLLPSAIRGYRTTIITNADVPNGEEVERVIEAGGLEERDRALGFTYPPGLFSLSHVALPFPMTDSLYGLTPDTTESFGVNLGALAPRGERNVLIASLDSLLRVSSNPFFPYMKSRIEEGIDSGARVKTRPVPETPAAGLVVPAGGWTVDDLVSFFKNFFPDRSDQSEDEPP